MLTMIAILMPRVLFFFRGLTRQQENKPTCRQGTTSSSFLGRSVLASLKFCLAHSQMQEDFLVHFSMFTFKFWCVLVVLFPLNLGLLVEAIGNEGTTASVQHPHIQGCSPSCKPSLKNQEGNQYLSSLRVFQR